MKKPLFTGVCTALVTPFRSDHIDYDMVATLLDRQMEAGIKAVVIAGTTGESPTLRDSEKIELFHFCKAHVGARCLVIAGTGSNNTAHSIELSNAAEQAGADALLVVSPYYNKATPEGIYQHYLAISKSVSIPVIIYNVPSRTGVDIPVRVYQRLAEIPNIAGVKEANPDITKITRIRNSCGEEFAVWSGNDDQIVPVMSLGGQGVISVLSNVKPKETVELCNAAQNENYARASELQCQLLPLIDSLFCEVNPIPAKAAMRELGFDCGGCRLPLCEMAPENLAKLRLELQ